MVRKSKASRLSYMLQAALSGVTAVITLGVMPASAANPATTSDASANLPVTPQEIRKIVGKLDVPNYNLKKTSAALVGRKVDFTLNHPDGGQTPADFLTIKSFKGVPISFTCKDFAGDFPKGTSEYRVKTAISKVTTEDGPEGDSFMKIELERCRS